MLSPLYISLVYCDPGVHLSGDPPEEPLALVTVGRAGGGPQDEVVGRGGGDGVDQGLQRLLVHVELLKGQMGLRSM